MTFTPSATSSFSAGAVFWAMVWSVVVKLDELLKLVPFYHPKARVSDRILIWVRSHKILTVTCTEIVNYSIHGVESPLGVMLRARRDLGEYSHGHVHRPHLVPGIEPGTSLIVRNHCPR